MPRNSPPREAPYPAELPHGMVYDSGDYDGALDKLLEHVDVEAFRREQAELRERGIYRGIGFSTYVEICGLAPSRVLGPPVWGMQGGYFESAIVRVHPTGSVTAYTGTSPHGSAPRVPRSPSRACRDLPPDPHLSSNTCS